MRNLKTSVLAGSFAFASISASALVITACSSDSDVAGNSAEIGNPEFASISGTLTLGDGAAAKTAVRCVPENFDVFKDKLPERWLTTTDSNGFYKLDSLPKNFTIEANSPSGEVLLWQGLTDSDTAFSHKLSKPGTLKIKADKLKDGDTVKISIPGTTYIRSVVIQNNIAAIDSLPATNISILFLGKDSVLFDEPIKIVSGGVISLLPETVAPKDSIPQNEVPKDTIPQNEVPPDTTSKDSVSKDTVPKDTVPKDTVPKDTVSKDTSQQDTVSKDTLPEAPAEPLHLQFEYPLAGLDIKNTVTQLPIALRLNKGDIDFEGIEKTDGAWVAKRGKNMLKLDNSYFDKEREQAVFWVLLDTLKAKSQDTITLYYDEGKKVNASGVFSKDFIAAWHFDEGISAAIDVANLQNGTPYNVKDTLGAVGGAYYYNGKTSYVDIENSSSGALNFDMTDTMCISVWAKIEDISTSRFILGKGSTQFHLKYYAAKQGWLFERYEPKTDTLDADICDTCSFNNSWRHWYQVDSVAKADEWAMLSIVQTGANFKFYLNGVLADDTASTGYFEAENYTGNDFVIGRQEIGESDFDQHFKGVIDELFIQRMPADSDRIKAMYENQRPSGYWPKLQAKD